MSYNVDHYILDVMITDIHFKKILSTQDQIPCPSF